MLLARRACDMVFCVGLRCIAFHKFENVLFALTISEEIFSVMDFTPHTALDTKNF